MEELAPGTPVTLEEFKADNARLIALNKRIALLYISQAERLEEAEQMRMAYGWDSCVAYLRYTGTISSLLLDDALEANPFVRDTGETL